MSDFWRGLSETAKSLGGAVAAPAGLVFDLSTAPFDDNTTTSGG